MAGFLPAESIVRLSGEYAEFRKSGDDYFQGAANSHFGENTASVTRYPNPNLKWETTTSYNLGTELGLFQRKVMVEAEYWWKHTEELLW